MYSHGQKRGTILNAQVLLARSRIKTLQMPERRMLEPQLFNLMLREVADRETLPDVHRAGQRLQRADEQLEQCRLP